MAFNAGEISAALVVDRTAFNAALDQAKADADKFAGKEIKAKVTADGTQAKTVLDDLTARADKLSGKAGTIKVSADASQANTEIDKTAAKADALAAKSPTVKVSADATAANAELDKTALKADALGRKTETVKVKADTSDASKGLSDLKKSIDGATAAFPLLATAIVGLGPAAVPVLGVVTAAVLPLSAAIGSAAAGLGAFGVVSKLVLTQAGTAAAAVSKAQTTYNAAIATGTKQSTAYATEQKAIAVAYAGMSTQQIALSKQVGQLDSAYKGMLKSVTPLVSSALVPWMKDVQQLLGYIKPLIAPVAALFQQWGTQLGQALSGNSAKISAFVAGFAGRSADNIRNFGDALVFFAKGAGALIHDIAPDLGGASLAVARLAASFDGWAHSQKTAADIQGFFAWVKTETPGVEKFLTTLAASLGNLLKAMAFTGGGDLKVLTAALSAVAALPPGAIAALADGYVALSLGLRAAAIATTLYGIAAKDAAGYTLLMRIQLGLMAVQETAVAAGEALATAATWLWDAAQAALDVVLLIADAALLPVSVVLGLIALAVLAVVAAIAAVAFGIYELVTHWHDVEEAALAAWHGILIAAKAVWGWVQENWPLLVGILLGPIATAAALIYLHWHSITAIFQDVLDWITGHWKLLLVILTGPIGAAALWIASHWSGITGVFSATIDWISAHWRLLLVILTGPVGLAALWLVHAWAGIHNDIDIAWNSIAAFFVGWWVAEVAKFTSAGRAIASVLSAGWNAISSATRAAWSAIASFFTSWWASEVAYFRGPVAAISNALKVAWSAIESAARATWGAISSFFASWWAGEVAAFRGPVAAIAAFLSAAWAGISSVAKSVFGGILSFFGGFWAALRAGFADAVSGIRTAWTAIQNVVKAPVDWVIRYVYDDLIVKFWNDVAGPVGLPTLKGLAEGGIVPGGYSRDDNQLVWMRSGEGVLQPGAVAALGGRGFIDWANAAYGDVPVSASSPGHYAGGGLHIPNPLPAIGHAISTGFHEAVHAVTDVGGFFGSLVNDVKNGIYNGLTAAGGAIISTAAKAIPGSSGVADAMRAYPLKLWDGFAAWVTGHGPGPAAGTPYKGKFGAGVSQWSGDVLKALAMLGLPASDLGLVLYQMQTESGGNPNAINLTDINAQQGDPSRGLLQTIGTTFAAYRNPSLSPNIYDPLANIYAALNYAVHGPGIGSRPGQLGGGSGYDDGGWLQPGMTMVMNATGRPEPVLNGDQWDALTSAAGGNAGILARLDKLIRATEQAPASTGYHVGSAINGAAHNASFRSRYPRNS